MYDNIEEKPYKHKKKMEFLEAGFALFSERSIDAVTLEDVAKACGHGVATVYRYFGTKSGLLLEIAKWKWGEFFLENQKRRPADYEALTAAELFAFYLDSFVFLFEGYRELLRFNQFLNIYIRSGGLESGDLRMYQGLLKPVFGIFQAIEKKAEDGTLTKDAAPKEILSVSIHLMLAVVTRYAVGLVYEPEGFDPTAEIEIQKEMLLAKYTTH
ncbi:MAG: TetR/AcrR family transcriptional regulator [Firmicutes bacterium]|nr:TetR/AcrR family transcriptional regulator [Bacillota bacterium]